MKPFDYYEARDVSEALSILASGGDIRVLAGGCGILTLMKQKLYFPDALVNIKKIDALKYVRDENDAIVIGTLATQSEVMDATVVSERIPILSEALGFVATSRIRNMATVGGTIVHADPNSDVAPALLVLESKVRVTNGEGTKELPLDKVYKDFYETCIDRTELLEAIIIPMPSQGSKGTYIRFQVRKAMDKAMPGVAALVELEDDKRTIHKARIAMSGIGNIPIRLKEEEAYLAGREYTPDVADGISKTMRNKMNPIGEHQYSAEYKIAIAGITLKRAVAEAVRRAATHR